MGAPQSFWVRTTRASATDNFACHRQITVNVAPVMVTLPSGAAATPCTSDKGAVSGATGQRYDGAAAGTLDKSWCFSYSARGHGRTDRTGIRWQKHKLC